MGYFNGATADQVETIRGIQFSVVAITNKYKTLWTILSKFII